MGRGLNIVGPQGLKSYEGLRLKILYGFFSETPKNPEGSLLGLNRGLGFGVVALVMGRNGTSAHVRISPNTGPLGPSTLGGIEGLGFRGYSPKLAIGSPPI